MKSLRFVDLFAGMGGFHAALSSLGHECVFASELDEELRTLYLRNFPSMKDRVFGDIRASKDKIPEHDILCAGFPCQPFSKSGAQLGTKDETRGTLFHEVLDVLEARRPRFVLLENVGNFGRHDGGRTWRVVQSRLSALGYEVAGTEHLTPVPSRDWRDTGGKLPSGAIASNARKQERKTGPGLISPHHFGHPHHRERFFIVATLGKLPTPPFPNVSRNSQTSLATIEQSDCELSERDRYETRLGEQYVDCIEHWNRFVGALPTDLEIPSFPLWGDELAAKYPFENTTPWASAPAALGICFDPPFPKFSRKEKMLELLPNYAREEVKKFRHWKVRYIRQNREWWSRVNSHLPAGWEDDLKSFPPSLRKLEWNAKGEARDLWNFVLQFRPSGLRVKRYTSSPALVAMTSTQIPILGPRRRFITRTEGLRLQGFSDSHELPASRDSAFKALGNAVHVDVVRRIVHNLLENGIRNLEGENPLGLQVA